jgi:NAD(P)-dependent dehydrogenase (short-subunit alcohol dehydrogenase family)
LAAGRWRNAPQHPARALAAASRARPGSSPGTRAGRRPSGASAITFLLSGDAANINGAILPCDGGWSAI